METKTQVWRKEAIKAGNAGCACCPGTVEKLPMRTRMYFGFGGWTILKDGEVVFMDETRSFNTAPTILKFEKMARIEPEAEWIANLNLPLREAKYQRHGKNTWVLIETGLGFA